ncbi:MAG: F0F1 ATP synthase subunit A [Bacteroidales bacterium]|nr:F0F1 ATP synthase subunit A [Bacteroidales bacterium]
MRNKSEIFKLIPVFIFLIFFVLQRNLSFAQQKEEDTAKTEAAGEKQENKNEVFKPGPYILHHVLDAHIWHIAEIGEIEVAIYLPVILVSGKGVDIFNFNKFKPEEAKPESEEKGEKKHGEGTLKHNGYLYANGKITAEDGRKVYDFSITKNVLSLFISVILLCIIFISVSRAYVKRRGHAPKGFQSLIEPLILFVRDDVAKSAIGEKRYEKYMPFLLTTFFFIFINNLLGIVPFFPGGANVTGNIAVTMILALFTFTIMTFSTKKSYWIHIINTPGVPWWLKIPIPLMPVVETIGIFTKPFVLMVRLFANMTAGHIIALGFIGLIFIFGQINVAMGYSVSVVSIIFYVFMGLIELLVAFLQAYIFTLLSALYFGMAAPEEEHH